MSGTMNLVMYDKKIKVDLFVSIVAQWKDLVGLQFFGNGIESVGLKVYWKLKI